MLCSSSKAFVCLDFEHFGLWYRVVLIGKDAIRVDQCYDDSERFRRAAIAINLTDLSPKSKGAFSRALMC